MLPLHCAWPEQKTFRKNPPLPHSGRFVATFGVVTDFAIHSSTGDLKRLYLDMFQMTYLGIMPDRNTGRIVPNTLDSPTTSKTIVALGSRKSPSVAAKIAASSLPADAQEGASAVPPVKRAASGAGAVPAAKRNKKNADALAATGEAAATE